MTVLESNEQKQHCSLLETNLRKFTILWNILLHIMFHWARASEALMHLLQWFLCDSTPHKLFCRRSWNSAQRLVPLLTMSPWREILEKSSGSVSGCKNVLFFYIFARNYTSNKRIFLNFCTWRHYQPSNNTQWLENTYLLKEWLFRGKISH